MGIAPAIHPSLAVWLWLTTGVVWLWERRPIRTAVAPFLAGASIAAISLAIQLGVTYDVPRMDAQTTDRYVRAFIAFWDPHRGGVSFSRLGVWLNAGTVMIAALWLGRHQRDLPPPSLFLLRFIVVIGAISFAVIPISRIPAESMPLTLLVLMPARMLNFNVMVCVALLFGLLAVYRRTWWASGLMALLAIGLLFSPNSMYWEAQPWFGASWFTTRVDARLVLAVAASGLVAGSLLVGGSAPSLIRYLSMAAVTVPVLMVLALPFPERRFLDRTNDPLFAAAAQEKHGLLLTSGTFHLVQLYTRRPVLLDAGALDSLPYAPESGPAMDRILRDVYGIDLFHPPPEVKGSGAIPHGVNRPIWQRYSREKWMTIRRDYNVSQVLTRSDYTLDLPVAAETASFRLYNIPY
jgi:hypothetical protein